MADETTSIVASQPDAGAVHTDSPIGVVGNKAKPKAKAAPAAAADTDQDDPDSAAEPDHKGILSRFVKAVKTAGKHSPGEVNSMMRSARKGGEKSEGLHRLFMPVQFGESADPPEWIPYMPIPGDYKHPSYGFIEISRERNQNFVKNFKDEVYQNPIPIDGEHHTKETGAMGWIRDVRLNEDGSVDAKVEWTGRGRAMFSDQRYKFISPEWYDRWEDPATGQVFSDVLIGCAMTTRPFFKAASLRQLAASSNTTTTSYWSDEDDNGPEGQEDTDTLSDIVIDMVFDGLSEDEINGLVTAAIALARAGQAAYGRALGPAAITDNDDQIAGGFTAMSETTPTTAGSSLPAAAATAGGDPSVTTPVAAAEPLQFTAAQFSELQENNRKMAERLALVESESRVKRFTDEVRGRTDANNIQWIGDIPTHVKFMESLAKTFGEESPELTGYIDQQRTVAKQLQASELFRVQGTRGDGAPAGGAGTGNAYAKIVAAAEQLRAADPKMTKAAAIEEASLRNPQLYAEYQAELRG